MRRSSLIALVIGVGLVGVVGLALVAPDGMEKQARLVAAPTAAALGFDLAKLPPASVSGSSLLGTKSFHWEAPARDGVVNRLSYLVEDEKLCWSSIRKSRSQDHGCVVVRSPA